MPLIRRRLMAKRYLFGPVPADFADQYLDGPRKRGECLAFNSAGTCDLTIGPGDTWDSVLARLSPGWAPDFLVAYLPYTSLPAGLWSAPIPIIGLAPDANLLWHHYRHVLAGCDLILTDQTTSDRLIRQGLHQVHPALLFGAGQDFLTHP